MTLLFLGALNKYTYLLTYMNASSRFHFVNVNELCRPTRAFLGSWRLRICIMCWKDREGAEFISNKQTNEFTHRHSALYITTDDLWPCVCT